MDRRSCYETLSGFMGNLQPSGGFPHSFSRQHDLYAVNSVKRQANLFPEVGTSSVQWAAGRLLLGGWGRVRKQLLSS